MPLGCDFADLAPWSLFESPGSSTTGLSRALHGRFARCVSPANSRTKQPLKSKVRLPWLSVWHQVASQGKLTASL